MRGVDDARDKERRRRSIGGFFFLAPRRAAVLSLLIALLVNSQGETSAGVHGYCVREEMRCATGPVLMLPPSRCVPDSSDQPLPQPHRARSLPPFASHHNRSRTSFFHRRNEGCGWMARWQPVGRRRKVSRR